MSKTLNVWMSWSSGKDSTFALHELKRRENVEVTRLLTTVTKKFNRVSMHGVRLELLEAQAQAIGLPLEVVEIPSPCTNKEYEAQMASTIQKASDEGVSHIAFGDLFLQDIREYREKQLKGTGIQPLFPLWHRPTDELAREIIKSGTKAVLTCTDTRKLDETFSGREYDTDLLANLPPDIDPCGERGEFHSFVYDSPLFGKPIAITKGERVVREGFAFTDFERTNGSR
jgi:uncharacterized protein (TIGR00290 family)